MNQYFKNDQCIISNHGYAKDYSTCLRDQWKKTSLIKFQIPNYNQPVRKYHFPEFGSIKEEYQ